MSTSETVKEARNAEKEAKAVSKLVSRKLEGYMNYARREQRFDPSGRGYRTNPLMHKYDVMYKMLEMTEMEADHRKKVKAAEKEEKKEKKLAISPRLAATSRRVTLNHEAERLTNNANTVFETLPVEKLTKIHRYRPHSDNVEDVTDNGKVMNYTRHIGAALHSETYVQYYQKEGLETGSKMKSPRLQKIKPKPKDTEKKSPRENEGKDSDKNEDPKQQDERYAPKKAAHYMVQNGKPISLDDKEEEKDLRTKKWVKERQTNEKDSNLNKTNSINKNSDDKDHETDEEQLDTASVISQQSMQSNTSHKSNQSKCSNHSNKSKASSHSNKSKASTNSNKSNRSQLSNKSKGSNHSNKSKGSHQSEKNYCGNLTADEVNDNEDESIKCVGEQVNDKNNDQNEHSEEHFDKVNDDHVNDKGQENNMDDQNNNLHDNKSDDNNSNDNKSEQNYSDDNTEEHNNLGDNEINEKNVKKHHSEDTQSTSSATEIYSSVEHIDRRSNMLN